MGGLVVVEWARWERGPMPRGMRGGMRGPR